MRTLLSLKILNIQYLAVISRADLKHAAASTRITTSKATRNRAWPTSQRSQTPRSTFLWLTSITVVSVAKTIYQTLTNLTTNAVSDTAAVDKNRMLRSAVLPYTRYLPPEEVEHTPVAPHAKVRLHALDLPLQAAVVSPFRQHSPLGLDEDGRLPEAAAVFPDA